MSRLLAALLLLLVSTAAGALTLDPAMRCDGRVVIYDTSVREMKGDHQKVVNDFVTRLRQYAGRLCGPDVEVAEHRRPGALLRDLEPEIVRTIERDRPATAFVHAPYADIEAGASIEELLGLQQRILAACDRTGTTCILGGQQPVGAMSEQADARQVELERAAQRAFADRYLALHAHFRSGLAGRRLMMRVDLGDGRALAERGHLLLFTLIEKRLIGLAPPERP